MCNISGCVQSWKHRERNKFIKKAFSAHPLHPAEKCSSGLWLEQLQLAKFICQTLQRSKLALYPQILKEQEEPKALLQQPARQESNLSWIPAGQGQCWALLGGGCCWRELFIPQTGPKMIIYDKNPQANNTNQSTTTSPCWSYWVWLFNVLEWENVQTGKFLIKPYLVAGLEWRQGLNL